MTTFLKRKIRIVNFLYTESETWECNYIKLKALIIGDAPLEALQQATSHLWDEMDLTEARGLKV